MTTRVGWFGWLRPEGWCSLCGNRIRRWPFGIWLDDETRCHFRCLGRERP
jgi:hypothetical protein